MPFQPSQCLLAGDRPHTAASISAGYNGSKLGFMESGFQWIHDNATAGFFCLAAFDNLAQKPPKAQCVYFYSTQAVVFCSNMISFGSCQCRSCWLGCMRADAVSACRRLLTASPASAFALTTSAPRQATHHCSGVGVASLSELYNSGLSVLHTNADFKTGILYTSKPILQQGQIVSQLQPHM